MFNDSSSRNSRSDALSPAKLGKGQSGVSTNGVTAIFTFFDRGTIWVLPLTYFCLPQSAGAYLSPQSVKIHYFCSGPISVDPICPQPRAPLEKKCSALWSSAVLGTPLSPLHWDPLSSPYTRGILRMGSLTIISPTIISKQH